MDVSRLHTMRALLTEQLAILDQICGEAEKSDGLSDAKADVAATKAGQTGVYERSNTEGQPDATKKAVAIENVKAMSGFPSAASRQFSQDSCQRWDDLSQPLVNKSHSDIEIALVTRGKSRWDSNRLHLRQKRRRQSFNEKILNLQKDQNLIEEVDLYKDDGFAAALVQSESFRFLVGVMILANAIWVGIATDRSPDSSNLPLAFKVLNSAFCLFFVFELVMRWLALEKKGHTARAPTFIFDTLVIAEMIWESWICPLWYLWSGKQLNMINLSACRIIRVARLGRLLKFKRDAPELLFYAQGLWKGLKATFPLLILLLLLGYAVAIVLVQTLWQTEAGKEYFGSVLEGCHFLFWSALANFNVEVLTQMFRVGGLSWVVFVLYMLVGNLTVSKMLTGVLVQVVQSLVSKEKEKAETQALEQNIARVADELGKGESGSLSLAEFEELVDLAKHPELIQSMHDHGVDIAAFVEHTRFAFPKKGGLLVDEVIDIAKKFCGFKPATVRDVVEMRKFFSMELQFIRLELKAEMELAGNMMKAINVNQHKLDLRCKEGHPVLQSVTGLVSPRLGKRCTKDDDGGSQ